MDGQPEQARWAAFSDLEVEVLQSAVEVADGIAEALKPDPVPPQTSFGAAAEQVKAELDREAARRGIDAG